MSAADMFWAAPPVSRTITAAAVLLSVPVHMHLLEPYYVVFLPYKLLRFMPPPEIWRLFTAFVITGPGFSMLMDPYFLFTYGSALETQSARFSRPGDFFVYLVFVSTIILPLVAVTVPGNEGECPCIVRHPIIRNLSSGWSRDVGMVGIQIERTVCQIAWLDGGFWALHNATLYNTYVSQAVTAIVSLTYDQLLGGFVLSGFFLLSPLTLALAYTYAQENAHAQVNYFIITFSAKWLPYTMLATTFVMGSPGMAILQASGLVAAHAYDFLTRIWPTYGGGRNYISTPAFVQRWFAVAPGTASSRGFGTAFTGQTRPPTGQQNAAGGSTGWSSSFGGASGVWGQRGQGRRLGGD